MCTNMLVIYGAITNCHSKRINNYRSDVTQIILYILQNCDFMYLPILVCTDLN